MSEEIPRIYMAPLCASVFRNSERTSSINHRNQFTLSLEGSSIILWWSETYHNLVEMEVTRQYTDV